ncbi:MAG: DUF885 family protein, partial [Planctomycetota bacterium]
MREFTLAFLLAAACRAPGKEAMDAATELRKLGDEYWEWVLRENPTYATYLGDFRYNDRLADLSEAAQTRRRAQAKAFLDRLGRLPLGTLAESDRVTAEILRLQLEFFLEEDRHKFRQWDVDQMGGPQADFPQLLNYHPHSDEAGLRARFRAFPEYIAQYLENLRAGIREGRTAVRPAVDRVIGQLRELLARPPEESPFAVRPALVPDIRDAVYPAYRAMLEFLEREYLPHARTRDMGLSALPGGREAY